MLNQNERSPLSVAEQVASIYAGTGGYLDRIKTERVHEFLGAAARAPEVREQGPDGPDRRRRSSPTRTRRSWARRSPRWSTTSAPTSTRTASRSRRASPTASSPRRSARGPAAPTRRPRPRPTPRRTPTKAEKTVDEAEEERGRGADAGHASPWPPRRKSRTGSRPSRTSTRSRVRWRWSPPRGCAAPSSGSTHMRPYAQAIRKMTQQVAEAAAGRSRGSTLLEERENVETGRDHPGHRRPRPRRRLQHPDHPRGRAAQARVRRRRRRASLLGRRPPRQLDPDLPRRDDRPTPTSASPTARPSPTRARSRATSPRPTSTRSSTGSSSSTTATSRR